MKVDKILNDMVKAYFKDKNKFSADYHYGLDDNSVYVIYKGVVAYEIPRGYFVLDIEKIFADIKPFTGVKQLFRLKDEAKPLEYSYYRVLDNKLGVNVYGLDGESIAIDYKLLKTFEDGKHEITLKGINYKSPVFVYDYDVLVGLIMPVNVKK